MPTTTQPASAFLKTFHALTDGPSDFARRSGGVAAIPFGEYPLSYPSGLSDQFGSVHNPVV